MLVEDTGQSMEALFFHFAAPRSSHRRVINSPAFAARRPESGSALPEPSGSGKEAGNRLHRISHAAIRDLFVIGALLSVWSFPCVSQAQTGMDRFSRASRIIMGTSMEITVSHPEAKKAEEAMEAAFQEVEKVNFLMSHYRPESEVSRISRNAGTKEVVVSVETLEVIERALFFSRLSGGAFDVTIGPVFRLWDFRAAKIPDDETLRENLKRVDYRKLRVDSARSSVLLEKPGMELDLGAIAKGYAVDRACEALQRKGMENFLVNAGGDLKAHGARETGVPWVVGVRHPRGPSDFLAKIRPRNAAVATSGDYEKFFIKEGERYHHILNPLNGKPARKCQSVTVMTTSGMDADALATAVFVLGPAKGFQLLEKIPNSHGIVVNARGNVLVSPSWPEGVLIPP